MDLEKGGKSKHAQSQLLLQKMPHIISHQERVSLFRKYVQNEKAVLGLCGEGNYDFTFVLISSILLKLFSSCGKDCL
jgi:hypothetical protein